MLTKYDEQTVQRQIVILASRSDTTPTITGDSEVTAGTTGKRLSHMLRVEWLGQTFASLCWIASVLSYGVSSTGDWLQLSAASAWLLANIATIVSTEVD